MCNYKFFSHKNCEYFPCHKVENEDDFNCLFCYCPLYGLGEACDGNYKYNENGIKDCSDCMIPHSKNAFEYVMAKSKMVIDLAKK